MLQPPGIDYRFSMADSEWSRCDSDEETQHIQIPNHNHPLYDVPAAELSPRVLLPTSMEDERHLQPTTLGKTVTLKSDTKIKNPSKSLSKQKRRNSCFGVFLAFLTLLILATAGLLVYIVLKWNLLFDDSVKFVDRETYERDMSNQTIKLNMLQMMLDAVTSELNKDCRNDVEISSMCFSLHLSDSGVHQAQAVFKCKIHGKNASLAMLDRPEIADALLEYISEGSSLWVDGSRKSDGFRFSDGRALSRPSTSTLENCLSLHRNNGSAVVDNTNCYNDLSGYICQYPLNKPAASNDFP